MLSNTGSYAITGATFVDTLPANTTYVSSGASSGTATYSAPALSVAGINLTSGATATIQLTVALNSPLVGVTQISNQGVAGWDANQSGRTTPRFATDGDPTTAGQQPTITAIAHTDLAVTKTVADNNPAETGAVAYTVGCHQSQSNAATSVTVADALPVGLTLATSSATQGAYVNPTWSVGTGRGASAT
ncbi:MAG: DUF11 domain-containing protein [Anaerolineales bacterium]|nr:DUF11 domain-containing protein [Anaerolineales bacterium]